MIGSVQEKFCFSDKEAVFSFHMACEEILKNVFTTEQGFDQDDRDDISCDADSIATSSTHKIRNSVLSERGGTTSATQTRSRAPKHRDFSTFGKTESMIFKAENLAELQYRTNKRAQRIQREYEKRLHKSEDDRARRLHERYGNRADVVIGYTDVNRERPLGY